MASSPLNRLASGAGASDLNPALRSLNPGACYGYAIAASDHVVVGADRSLKIVDSARVVSAVEVQLGALLVAHRRIAATGFNGTRCRSDGTGVSTDCASLIARCTRIRAWRRGCASTRGSHARKIAIGGATGVERRTTRRDGSAITGRWRDASRLGIIP